MPNRVSNVLLIGVLLSAPAAVARTPLNWIEWGGHGYAADLYPHTWDEAQALAASLGAHLVVISSPEEDAFLRQTFVIPFWGDMWIGAYQPDGAPEPDGQWAWVNGEPFVYSNWLNNEPNNNGNAQVAHIFPELAGWADEMSTTPYYAVFERGPTIPAVSVWGAIILAHLLVLTGTLVFAGRTLRT